MVCQCELAGVAAREIHDRSSALVHCRNPEEQTSPEEFTGESRGRHAHEHANRVACSSPSHIQRSTAPGTRSQIGQSDEKPGHAKQISVMRRGAQ